MARVYYRENKLLGKAFRSDIITVQLFHEILAMANPANNQFKQFELPGTGEERFKTAVLWKGDFYYKYKGQEVYLPHAIILGDDFSTAFPDEYYFVAQIGDHLDVRRVNAGQGFEWHQTIDTSMPHPEDEAFSNKLERSFLILKQEVEQAKSQAQQKIARRVPIAKEKIQACTTLAALCEWTPDECTQLGHWLASQKVEDEEPYTLLGIIEDYCYEPEKNRKLLFMYFDWKEVIKEFVWKLENILKNNYGITDPIPTGRFTLDSQIYENGVQAHFDQFLRTYQLQLTQVKTEGDDYLFMVHNTAYHRAINLNVNIIGWGTARAHSYGWAF